MAALGHFERRAAGHPLPKGEGQGEGELGARRFHGARMSAAVFARPIAHLPEPDRPRGDDSFADSCSYSVLSVSPTASCLRLKATAFTLYRSSRFEAAASRREAGRNDPGRASVRASPPRVQVAPGAVRLAVRFHARAELDWERGRGEPPPEGAVSPAQRRAWPGRSTAGTTSPIEKPNSIQIAWGT